MNEQGEQIKKNFLDQWIRLAFVVLYIIVFGLLWRFIAVLMLVVIILQSLHRVIAAENNRTLLTFSEGLGNFLLKVMNYVLYLSDDKPIDFDAFFNRNDKTENNASQASEESAPQTEDIVVEAEAEEEEPELETENSSKATTQATASSDDVFADISFTEQTEDPTDNADGEDDQSKKPE